MKRIKLAFSGVLGFIMPVVVFAAAGGTIPTGPVTIDKFWTDSVCPVTNWLFTFVLLAAVITLLVAAAMFFTSKGDESKVTTARKYIMWGLVGAGIAILSKTLVIVLGSVLGVSVAGFLC